MKIICAPDSFKESISAAAAAEAMACGIRQVAPDAVIDLCPVADGGEGTVDALVAATGGAYRTTTVTGPLGRTVEARWGMLGSAGGSPPTAVIEMAAASGLALVAPERRDPTATSTFGTGELIAAALDAAARRIIVGIGGSGTNDGGCGMAQALGVAFHDDRGEPITDECVSGAMLERLTRIDMSTLDPRIADTQITVACDVTNPLTGKSGAAHVYAPQKGAIAAQVEQLDRGLRHLAELIRRQLGRDIELMPGAGAAGGLGGGLVAFLGATLRQGIEVVLEAVNFDQRVGDCALCLTGEGRLDNQSLAGKAVIGVAQTAARHRVPTIALVGSLGPGHEQSLEAGLTDYFEIGRGLPIEESIARAAELLEAETIRAVSSHGV